MNGNWTKKRRSMKEYDDLVVGYDAQYEKEQSEKFDVALHSLSLDSSAVVLDAGCGTGLLMERLAKTVRLVVGVAASDVYKRQERERGYSYF